MAEIEDFDWLSPAVANGQGHRVRAWPCPFRGTAAYQSECSYRERSNIKTTDLFRSALPIGIGSSSSASLKTMYNLESS